MTPLLPNFYAWCMAAALFGLLFLLAVAVGQSLRARRRELEAAETNKRDLLHRFASRGFRSARERGWVDERGNVLPRFHHRDDVQ